MHCRQFLDKSAFKKLLYCACAKGEQYAFLQDRKSKKTKCFFGKAKKAVNVIVNVRVNDSVNDNDSESEKEK